MITLDSRLNDFISTIEMSNKVTLTASEKEKIKEGIIVGMHPSNTMERAESLIVSRFLAVVKARNATKGMRDLVNDSCSVLSPSESLQKTK